jgi:hypothetical protein
MPNPKAVVSGIARLEEFSLKIEDGRRLLLDQADRAGR